MPENIESIIDSEKEWRRYMIKRLDALEKDFNIFKFKAIGFMAACSAIIDLAFRYLSIKK